MVKRVNISFPEKTLEDLKELVPPRERSKVVTEAVEAKLTSLRRKEALEKIKKLREKFKGFEFIKSKEDAVAYVRKIRRESDRTEELWRKFG